MRLRRMVAVGAVAAGVIAATTAAAFPSAPVDQSQPLPALTTQALAARYAADSRMITQAARAAGRAGNQPLASALRAMRGEHFIDLNPAGQGLAVEVIGDLAHATRVAILVPGSDTSLATFGSRGTASPDGAAHALAAQTRKLDPGARLAIIAWLGYSTPATLSPAVMTSGDAGQGASALRPLVDDLARHGDQVALICHSYGSVVCGLAAPQLPVTDIAVIGSPGMDASSVRGAAHHRARVGGPGSRRLDPRRAPHPVARARLRPGSDGSRRSAPGSSPAAAAVTATTSGRAASPCATWPTSRSATPPGSPDDPPPGRRVRHLAARIDAATPAHRDRTVDALRALAIAGVILGHWLVTALVLTPGHAGGTLHDTSPLAAMPALTPVSWIFQTLAIFFFVGGYAAARSFRGDYRAWLGKRLARLSRPVAALAAVWALLATGLYLGGVPWATLHTVLTLVLDPLWFLGVFAGLTALTPLAVALVRRFGARAALIPFLVVAGVDAVRFGLGGPPGRRLDQRRGRLDGPLSARHRVGTGRVPGPHGPGLDARRRDRGHRGAGPVGRIPGQHGRA